MTATKTLSFSIDVHPPPRSWSINQADKLRPVHLVTWKLFRRDTSLEEVTIQWDVDHSQDVTMYEDLEILDCAMWSPGVHKIRATLTSPQGRKPPRH